MSRMSGLMIELQEEIMRGEHSLELISRKYNVPMQWVDAAYAEVLEQYRLEDMDMGDVFLNEAYEA